VRRVNLTNLWSPQLHQWPFACGVQRTYPYFDPISIPDLKKLKEESNKAVAIVVGSGKCREVTPSFPIQVPIKEG